MWIMVTTGKDYSNKRDWYFTNCAEAWMQRAETDPGSEDMREVS